MSRAPVRYRVWVGGLPHGVTEEDLYSKFSKYGPVQDVTVRHSKSDTYSFITYTVREDAEEAIARMDRSSAWGSPVKVNMSKDFPPTGPRRRGADGRPVDPPPPPPETRCRAPPARSPPPRAQRLAERQREPSYTSQRWDSRGRGQAGQPRQEQRAPRSRSRCSRCDAWEEDTYPAQRRTDTAKDQDYYPPQRRGNNQWRDASPPRKDFDRYGGGRNSSGYQNEDSWPRDRGRQERPPVAPRPPSPPRPPPAGNGRAASERPASERPASERPASERPAADRPDSDRPAPAIGRYRLTIENIPDDMSWLELKDLGKEYGQSATFSRTYRRGSVFFGMLEFGDQEDAKRTIRELDGRRIQGGSAPMRVYEGDSWNA